MERCYREVTLRPGTPSRKEWFSQALLVARGRLQPRWLAAKRLLEDQGFLATQ
ncbi:hypothetical protein BHE74_00050483, partial [Ensete ventricosum]